MEVLWLLHSVKGYPLSKDEMEELYRLETNIWHACDVQRQEGDRLAKVQQARDFNISV